MTPNVLGKNPCGSFSASNVRDHVFFDGIHRAFDLFAIAFAGMREKYFYGAVLLFNAASTNLHGGKGWGRSRRLTQERFEKRKKQTRRLMDGSTAI